MDYRERFAGEEEALRMMLRGDRAGLWTALPGIVQSFDAVAVTVVVQPALQGVVQNTDGTYRAVNLPLLLDVPVCFPRGGGCTLTFPVRAGDECLVVFSARCIDGWWQSGGIQLPMEPRLHDLSDGFAIVGPQSQPNKIENISTTSVQLRTDDGQGYVDMNTTTRAISLTTPSTVTINAGSVTINSDVQLNGSMNATVDVVAGGVSLHNHIHGGVKAGADFTEPPA